MNPYLDDDLIALAGQARRFATDRVAPGFQKRDRTRVLDRGVMKEMGAMGFIAPELPQQFGGLGLGSLAAGVIHEEVARADLSISGSVATMSYEEAEALSPSTGFPYAALSKTPAMKIACARISRPSMFRTWPFRIIA